MQGAGADEGHDLVQGLAQGSIRQVKERNAQRQMYDHSARLFERLECRDYARFDFRCDHKGIPKLLEVNPNPGWCWDGKLNLMAGFAGMRYADLLALILEVAQRRAAGAAAKPSTT